MHDHAPFYQAVAVDDPTAVMNLFLPLLNMPLPTLEAVEHWLVEVSRLNDRLTETLSGHYIDSQLDSTDESKQRVVLHDQQVIKPLLDKLNGLLNQKLFTSGLEQSLDSTRYSTYIQSKQNAMRLYQAQNVELQRQEAQLKHEYLQVISSLAVAWEDGHKTSVELDVHLRSADRTLREQAWKAIQQARSTLNPQIEAILDQLLVIRHRIAQQAGFANYRDYMFHVYERYDYTPDDLYALHQSIQTHLIPLKQQVETDRMRALGLTKYRPWDTLATPEAQTTLRPFSSQSELVAGVRDLFAAIDPDFSLLLDQMQSHGLLDLDSRQGKAPGNFCTYLPVSKLSFVYMNVTEVHSDMVAFVHEMGHAIHQFLCRDLDLAAHRQVPMETAELASLTMELLSMEQWDRFYHGADLVQAKREQLTNILYLLTSGGMIDEFQHWLYEHPAHTQAERQHQFRELTHAYNGIIAMDGYDDEMANQWRYLRHLFQFPFYYIEYVIAQLGALQIWRLYKQDPVGTITRFKQALRLGKSRSIAEVYQTAGIRFAFDQATIEELTGFLQQELAQLEPLRS